MSTGKLAEALAKAQAEIGTASKDAENPHFRSRYATLASVWAACRAPLARHGLSVVQIPGSDGDLVTLTTVLLHSSGESISGAMSVRPGKPGPQALGSALTYLRRYALAAMVGVAVGDDDDDGETAERRGPQQRPQQRREPPPQQPTGHHQSWSEDRARFCARLGDLGIGYQDLAHATEAKGWGRPSAWDSARRARALSGLTGGAGPVSEALAEWRAAVATTAMQEE